MLDAEAKMSEAGVLTLSPGVREDSWCHPSSQFAQQQDSFLLPLPPASRLLPASQLFLHCPVLRRVPADRRARPQPQGAPS